jgi:hypothetical protein
MVARRILLKLWAGPARLDDAPAISGRLGIMDDDRGGGALARGFLELVGPAAIIGHRTTAEIAGERHGLPVGIVDQDDDRLPLHVEPGIVVPAALGRIDAVPDEHDLAVLHLGLGHDLIGRDDHVGAIGEADRGLAPGEAERRHVLAGDLDQRHVLEPVAIVAGLEARRLEALDDIGSGLVFGGRRRRATLEIVGRQRLRHILQRL